MSILTFPEERDTSLQRVITRSVRRLMADRDVTQEQLGQVLGIRQASVSRRMKGDSPWQLADLEAIAAAFGISVVELLGGTLPSGPGGGGLPRLDLNQRTSDYMADGSDEEPSDLAAARERRRNLRAARHWNPFSPRRIRLPQHPAAA